MEFFESKSLLEARLANVTFPAPSSGIVSAQESVSDISINFSVLQDTELGLDKRSMSERVEDLVVMVLSLKPDRT